MAPKRSRRKKKAVPIDRPRPKRSFGQNFLTHGPTINTIADFVQIPGNRTVIELGVGRGALTRALAHRVGPDGRVIGFEIDRELVRWLRAEEILPENVELRHEDMLTISLSQLQSETGGPVVIAANLPYNISTEIVFKLIEERDMLQQAVLMFQKEVAERLIAGPGSKKYGVISVLVGQCMKVKKLMDVPPGLFSPRPKVVSSVIEIRPSDKSMDVGRKEVFRLVVKQAFSKRRKTIRNALRDLYSACPSMLDQALEKAGIDPAWRPEMIDVKAFALLARFSQSCLSKED